MPQPLLITLGCRLNAFETEVMRRHADAAGLDDCVIVNTCAVTAEAVRQAGQAIRRARRQRPEARIIVTGCAAQIEPHRFAEMPEVDHVVGNADKTRAATFHSIATQGGERIRVNDIMSVSGTASHMIDGFGSRARAYIEVQNGCDHRCTFCIIPYGRGPSRSVSADDVVAQVRRLVESGYQEVVLTGVDITSYGLDVPGEVRLGKLVRRILREVPELSRLRLSSIDQVETDNDLLDALSDEPRLMPHLHLSLQSGDDLVLKRMKRRHQRADAIRFCAQVRRLRPDIVFGADLIAGFPTEDEDMFERTVDMLDECGLTFLHVFPFSARAGTPAARMPQQRPGLARERAERLRREGERRLAVHLDRETGRETQVLVEQPGLGRTPHFAEVAVEGANDVGAILPVHLQSHDGRRFYGEVQA